MGIEDTEFQVQVNPGRGTPSFAVYQLTGSGLLVQSRLIVKFPATESSEGAELARALGRLWGEEVSDRSPEFVELKGIRELETWMAGFIKMDISTHGVADETTSNLASEMAKLFVGGVSRLLERESEPAPREIGGYL
jgi:hypothetical protein